MSARAVEQWARDRGLRVFRGSTYTAVEYEVRDGRTSVSEQCTFSGDEPWEVVAERLDRWYSSVRPRVVRALLRQVTSCS